MSDGIMLTIGDDGEATLYDDTYDITIHCESKEEQDEVKKVLENIPHWIPVTERLPESAEDDLEYPTVLVCFDNGDVDIACFYESTKEWGCGDMYDRICHPIAWQPLPQPYKAEGSEE